MLLTWFCTKTVFNEINILFEYSFAYFGNTGVSATCKRTFQLCFSQTSVLKFHYDLYSSFHSIRCTYHSFFRTKHICFCSLSYNIKLPQTISLSAQVLPLRLYSCQFISFFEVFEAGLAIKYTIAAVTTVAAICPAPNGAPYIKQFPN